MVNYETLARYSKDELIELIGIYAKNTLALDGVWFQSVERKCGMDEAMHHDVEAWRRFTVTEARRIKRFLKLGEHPGLEGLALALKHRFNANINPYEIRMDESSLTLTVRSCSVQDARAGKGMPWHPCKPVGLVEYAGFGSTIDSRITCECVSCYPDVTIEGCGCVWRFSIGEEE